MLNHLAFAYNVQSYLQLPVMSTSSLYLGGRDGVPMLEEYLLLLITLVTELPLLPDENRMKDIVRRECIHKLVGGPVTYSQLSECLAVLPDNDKPSSNFIDLIIAEIGEWMGSGNSLDPDKIKLKPSMWASYDPCFWHTSHKMHLSAMELRPKATRPTAIVSPPLAAHPVFAKCRSSLLLDRTLHVSLFSLLTLFVAARRVSDDDKYSYARIMSVSSAGVLGGVR